MYWGNDNFLLIKRNTDGLFFLHEHQHGSIVFCSHGQEARSVYSAVKGNTLGHRAAMPSISPGSQFLLFSVSPKMPIGPIAFKNPTTLRTLLWIWICERWHPGTPICYARHFPRVGRWFCNGDRLENLPFVLQEKCQIVWKSSEKETGKIVTQWKRLMCSLKNK